MLDQLSCAVGALHFGEIWNQLGEGGPNCPNVSPTPGVYIEPGRRRSGPPVSRPTDSTGGGRPRTSRKYCIPSIAIAGLLQSLTPWTP